MATAEKNNDLSNGWDAIANDFIRIRRINIGLSIMAQWTKTLDRGQSVLDVGCGFGGMYTQLFLDRGLNVYGIDPSQTLIGEYRRRYPEVVAKCEAAEASSFYDTHFDGIVSVGLIFLLAEPDQVTVLQKMGETLKIGGGLLFTAPYQLCEWDDLLTARKSRSLGKARYLNILEPYGLELAAEFTDEGESHYYSFVKMHAL